MSSDEDLPPAPPVRLTSNRGCGDRSDSASSVDMRPLPKGKCSSTWNVFLFTACDKLKWIVEPDDADRKKKTLKSKIKGSKPSHDSNKPNISYPTNFEHTVHVGFDAVTGEFTVSFI